MPEVEPRVITSDVRDVLRKVVRPGDDDGGEAVSMIAEKAETSTRTIYRVLATSTESIGLDLADRLVLAAGGHLSACRLQWEGGEVTPYLSARVVPVADKLVA